MRLSLNDHVCYTCYLLVGAFLTHEKRTLLEGTFSWWNAPAFKSRRKENLEGAWQVISRVSVIWCLETSETTCIAFYSPFYS